MGKVPTENRYLVDADGDVIPCKMIDSTDIKEHDMVEYLLGEAQTVQSILQEFKKKAEELLCNHLDSVAERYGEEWKGNATLYNYPRTKAIEFKISKTICFDEKLEIAKQKIFNCIERWSEGAQENIVILVKKAFDTDKAGLVDTKRVLALTTLKIEDIEWMEAVEIIRASIINAGSKRYINFKVKESDTKSLKPISLNFSAL